MGNIKIEDLKPGMQVRIVSERGVNWNPRMNKWLGKVMTVRKVRDGVPAGAMMEEDKSGGYGWFWNLENIAEIIYPEIHITCKGNTVHAVLKKGDKVERRARADCHPDDTFDLAIGARLAFERVLEEDKHTEEEKRESLRLLELMQELHPDTPFVAVDEDEGTYTYTNMPSKENEKWRNRGLASRLGVTIPILSWDDTKPVHIPTKIEELRKELGE